MPTAHSRFDMRAGVRIGDDFYDHDFTDLPRDSDGLAHTFLTATDGRGFDIWQDESFKHIVIFTPDFYFANVGESKRYACAIEPQTSGPNSFNSGEDLLWLKQGQTFSATWGINLLTK
jgi:aldose 1-epimerase